MSSLDLERIARREVAAAHMHPLNLHTKESRVRLQNVADAIIVVTRKDPDLPWFILVPGRVLGPFVLLTNEQQVSPPLPGHLHQEVLGVLPSPEVEFQVSGFNGRNVDPFFQDQEDLLLPGSSGGQDPQYCVNGVHLRLHFFQDFSIWLFIPRRNPDCIARPGGWRASWRLLCASFLPLSFSSGLEAGNGRFFLI